MKLIFEVEFDDRGNIRISLTLPNGRTIKGEYVTYTSIATLKYDHITYYAVSQYYDGSLPVETVFTINEVK